MKYDEYDLAEMLTYVRDADSNGEKEFIRKYIDSVPGMKRDGFGNRYIRKGNPDTCFACHTDTVHRWSKKPRQKVYVKKFWAFTGGENILGADDGTGCWICLNLIYAGVPGLYIFHRQEECGGGGSRYIAQHPQVLNGIKKVVSLDRKGYTDIITHQGYSETCSKEFATALMRQLNGRYTPCDGGIFTDSANYVWIVPECTNLSIGYFNAHSVDEVQDLGFAKRLAKRMMGVNWKSLPVFRQVTQFDKKSISKPYGWYGYKPATYKQYYGYRGSSGKYDDRDWYSWW
jgi:hypothetical protein